MRTSPLLAIAVLTTGLFACNDNIKRKPRLLVLSSTSSPVSGTLLRLGTENGFEADTTSNVSLFNEDSLGRYSAVVLTDSLNSKDTLFNQYERNALTRFREAGGKIFVASAESDSTRLQDFAHGISDSIGNGKLDYSRVHTLKNPTGRTFHQNHPESWRILRAGRNDHSAEPGYSRGPAPRRNIVI